MTMHDGPNRMQSLEFRGTAGEYFKIWFVNFVLTLLTLGIYSAWAKVRNRRYLYGNTYLLGSSFEYLADPWKILKGRIVAVVFLVLLGNIGYFAPTISGVLFIALIFLTPWVIIRTMRFNLVNTAYRNLRFGFDGTYQRAFWVFLGLPVLTALSAGLAYPYFISQKKKFLIDNSRYGRTHFSMDAEWSSFYGPYTTLSLGLLIYLTALVLLVVGLQFNFNVRELLSASRDFLPYALVAVLAPLMAAYAYLDAALTNLTFGSTRLNGYLVDCRLKTLMLLMLNVTNLLAIVFSFGLLTPWTIIRSQRYRLSAISVNASADSVLFNAGENENPAAVGEEISDIFDIDIGL